MEFKCECDPHGRKEPSGINRIIMEFKSFIRVLFPELFKAELIESYWNLNDGLEIHDTKLGA